MWIGLIVATAVLLDMAVSDDKIVGSEFVKSISERPYMVHISFRGRQICGGGIIQPKWILTASHCLTRDKTELKDYQFMAGTVVITPPQNSAQIRKAKSMLFHPEFANLAGDDGAKPIYDIGAVEVKEKFKFTTHVKPMSFFQIDPVKCEKQIAFMKTNPKLDCTISGWGGVSETIRFSNHLKKLQVAFISDEDCLTAYVVNNPYYRNFSFLENKQHCVESVKGNTEGTYVGDSGSPLICNGFVIGVLSITGYDGFILLPSIIQSVSVMMDLFEQRNILCDEPNGCRCLIDSTTSKNEISPGEEPPSYSAGPSDDSVSFLTRTSNMYVLISAIVAVLQ